MLFLLLLHKVGKWGIVRGFDNLWAMQCGRPVLTV